MLIYWLPPDASPIVSLLASSCGPVSYLWWQIGRISIDSVKTLLQKLLSQLPWTGIYENYHAQTFRVIFIVCASYFVAFLSISTRTYLPSIILTFNASTQTIADVLSVHWRELTTGKPLISTKPFLVSIQTTKDTSILKSATSIMFNCHKTLLIFFERTKHKTDFPKTFTTAQDYF